MVCRNNYGNQCGGSVWYNVMMNDSKGHPIWTVDKTLDSTATGLQRNDEDGVYNLIHAIYMCSSMYRGKAWKTRLY